MPVGSSLESDWRMTPEGRENLERYRVDVHITVESFRETAKEDIRRGLTGSPMSLPPKYFYDTRGSALFQKITELPEYYLTRVEKGLLDSLADEFMNKVCPQEVIELGPGSPAKIRPFLAAQSAVSHLTRYVPFDISKRDVLDTAKTVVNSYPFLKAHGIVGDFEKDLGYLPPPVGRKLIVFLGSTIGNLDPHSRRTFLLQLRHRLAPGDRLLLGVDLVKDVGILEAAYNDPAGVTAEFNRNILRVVNKAVHGDFQLEAFDHYAYHNQQAQRIEMHLTPTSPQTVNLRDLALQLSISPDESIWTESSYKFTQESTEVMLEEAKLRLERWHTDSRHMFALALAVPD